MATESPTLVSEITCPKCKTHQTKSLSCSSCGIIYEKYGEKEVSDSQESEASFVSYADEVPGIKGSLLRFIDEKIDSFTEY